MSVQKVGYTEDGYVFMIVESQLNGKPFQTILQWDPKRAMEIADAMRESIIKANEIKGQTQ